MKNKKTDYLAQTWIDPRQGFGPSTKQGIGSFAQKPIKKGEVVEIVGGMLMSEEAFRAFQQVTPRYNAIQIGEDLHLVEKPEVTQAREGGSLNHSCDSNLWLADEVTLCARRDIAAGEEITIDYALFTTQADWVMERPCLCESPHCRTTISGNDWQLPEVQDRYYPYFSPYINRRIEEMKAQETVG